MDVHEASNSETDSQLIIINKPSEVVILEDITTPQIISDVAREVESSTALLTPGEMGIMASQTPCLDGSGVSLAHSLDGSSVSLSHSLDGSSVPLTVPGLGSVPCSVSTNGGIVLMDIKPRTVIADATIRQCLWAGCGQVLPSTENLVTHVHDSHIKLDHTEMYTCCWHGCPRNGKGFNARYKVLVHIRTHTNEKPHGCYICGKAFSRLENLKIHHRTHTGERPYVCNHEGCDKAYNNSSDRFKHMLTHSVDRPYSCKTPGCNKRYTDPSSLRKHVRIHGHRGGRDSAGDVTDAQLVDTDGGVRGSESLVLLDSPVCLSKVSHIPYMISALPSIIMPTLITTQIGTAPQTVLPMGSTGIPLMFTAAKDMRDESPSNFPLCVRTSGGESTLNGTKLVA